MADVNPRAPRVAPGRPYPCQPGTKTGSPGRRCLDVWLADFSGRAKLELFRRLFDNILAFAEPGLAAMHLVAPVLTASGLDLVAQETSSIYDSRCTSFGVVKKGEIGGQSLDFLAINSHARRHANVRQSTEILQKLPSLCIARKRHDRPALGFGSNAEIRRATGDAHLSHIQ